MSLLALVIFYAPGKVIGDHLGLGVSGSGIKLHRRNVGEKPHKSPVDRLVDALSVLGSERYNKKKPAA